MAGATPKELEKLISEQGKFEAKIGNETVFIGGIRADTGKKDITYVCRDDASCSGIQACQASGNGWYCNYRFVVHLSEEAAERHAQITSTIPINTTNPKYLEKQIDFYVDDTLTTSLFISDNLKGKKTTQIEIQGSGFGADRNSAIKDAQESMKHMQTILITGSLPYKLNVVKLDRVSPILGEKFNSTILLTGVICFIAVGIIIAVRYRNFKASILMLFINFTEIIIILGIAALIKWNLDLPSIVGILVTIGTGIDQQIVIIDESKSKRIESLKEKLKGAIFIIFSAYFTIVVSMLPLFWAGVGLLRGFAVTTLIGLTVGVLITRPAFADMVKLINTENVS